LLRVHQLTGKEAFKNIWISGFGLDEKGERMSKSKGNVVDPIPIIEKYGGDAFRFWNAAEANLGSDFRYAEEKIVGATKFLTKLWNVARFIMNFKYTKGKPTSTDKWILSELNKLAKICKKGYEDFNFFIPSNKVREFIWGVFAPHYVEMVKARAYNQDNKFTKEEQNAAIFTLHEVLKVVLKLFAPICPYITDEIWSNYSKTSVHLEELPEVKDYKMSKLTNDVIVFNNSVWKKKKDKGIALNAEIIGIKIPKTLKPLEKDLKIMHKIK